MAVLIDSSVFIALERRGAGPDDVLTLVPDELVALAAVSASELLFGVERRETATMSEQVHYSMLIQWSEEDQAYLVGLPEWEGQLFNWDAATHGATYEEAAGNGREVLELLVEAAREEGAALPAARVFATSIAR